MMEMKLRATMKMANKIAHSCIFSLLFTGLLGLFGVACDNSSSRASGLQVTVQSVDSASGLVSGTITVYGANGEELPLELPGFADRSFGTDGTAILKVECDIEARTVAVQSSGRILLAGHFLNEKTGKWEAIILAFTGSGVKDSTFGVDGLTVFNDPKMDVKTADLLVQPDDSILLLINAGDALIVIARYTADGYPDPDFGEKGLVVMGDESKGFRAGALALQPDQKIICAATINDLKDASMASVFAGMRFEPSGSLDDTFQLIWWTGLEMVASSVCIQLDGKVVVVGSSLTPDELGYAMYRALPDGTQDPSFESGILYDKKRPQITFDGLAVALQSDGKILISGNAHNADNGQKSQFVARQLPNGPTDDPFGTYPWETGGLGAILVRPYEEDSTCNDIAVQKDQKILISGTSTDPSSKRKIAFVTRVDIYGVWDRLFGVESLHSLSDPERDVAAAGLAFQKDGNVILAGTGSKGATGERAFMLARILTGGLQSFEIRNNSGNPVTPQVQKDGTWRATLQNIENGTLTINARYNGSISKWTYEITPQ